MPTDPESVAYRLIALRPALSMLPPEQAESFLAEHLSTEELDAMRQADEEMRQFMSQGLLHEEI